MAKSPSKGVDPMGAIQSAPHRRRDAETSRQNPATNNAQIRSMTASNTRSIPSGDLHMHASSRWADAVVRIISSQSDPKTISEWGHLINVSGGALRNWCRTAGLEPKKSLDFGRVLRAVMRHKASSVLPQDLLDVSDLRTLSRLLTLGDMRAQKNSTRGCPSSC